MRTARGTHAPAGQSVGHGGECIRAASTHRIARGNAGDLERNQPPIVGNVLCPMRDGSRLCRVRARRPSGGADIKEFSRGGFYRTIATVGDKRVTRHFAGRVSRQGSN